MIPNISSQVQCLFELIDFLVVSAEHMVNYSAQSSLCHFATMK